MSLIGWLKNNRLVDVTAQDPLPVQQQGAITTRTADTLLVATTTVTTDANRDLLGSTSTETPTLDGCMQYRKLVWLAHRASNTAINYTIRARATDHNSWNRIEIPATTDGYYDQYRIEVSVASGTVVLTSKIVGVR